MDEKDAAPSSTDASISPQDQAQQDAPATAGAEVGTTAAGEGAVSPAADTSASGISSSAPSASPDAGTGAPLDAEHPAHSVLTRIEKFVERVSSDFLKEGKALVVAARAEVDKLL